MGTHLMALLKSLSYVNVEKISEKKSKIIKGLDDAVKEVNDIKTGKKKGRNFEDFLNAL